MPKAYRLILYISVESFHGVSQIEPEGGWENPFLNYHIRVDCKNCNRAMLDIGYLPLYLCAGMVEDARYHKALTCPGCLGFGGLRILRRGGEAIGDEGQEMAVTEIEVNGSFLVHKKIKLFYFRWICRKDDDDDGREDLLGPFSVEKDGSYVFKNLGDESDDDEIRKSEGLRGFFLVTPWDEKVEGLWIKVASRLSSHDSDSDSDSSSED